METNITNESDFTGSHKVISSDSIISTNSKDIKQLINVIAKKYNISIEDAAFALTNVFKKIST